MNARFVGTLLLIALALPSRADNARDIAVIDAALAGSTSPEALVPFGDMVFRAKTLRAMRDQFAGRTVGPLSATNTGVVLWTSGNVYYAFNANVSAAHQQAFVNAAEDWAAWANLHFIPRVAQASYIMVNDAGAGLQGGNSAVGMIGGKQDLNIGSSAWNHGTLCHEIGHALGLQHEHQRTDRDPFLTELTANVLPGHEADLSKLPSTVNRGAYDFHSVMHYFRNAFSKDASTIPNPAANDPQRDTIEPTANYAAFLNVMGNETDRTLSKLDRAGMALMYGAPAVLPGAVVANTKESGAGSLRTALEFTFDRGVDFPGTTTTVTFNLPTSDPGYDGARWTLRPANQLFAPGDGTAIDATTQPGAASLPRVTLSGVNIVAPTAYAHGVILRAANCVVRGLAINGFNQNGILLTGAAATGNVVSGCFIGTNAAGTAASANLFAGIEITAGASANTIGGATAATRNVIAGNIGYGIALHGTGVTGNLVTGNFVGTNAAGAAALANGFAGIGIYEAASANTVGGTAAGARNHISGNTNQGVFIFGPGTNANAVIGNAIGLNAAGTAALPNTGAGVFIFTGAHATLVGGTAPGAGNIIAGNGNVGVGISDAGTTGTLVQGNLIGLTAAGSALANGGAGVIIYNAATATTIGGTTPGAGNVISGNANQGVLLSDPGTSGNFIQGNLIGTNPAGTAAVPNAYSGVGLYSGAAANLIGGTVPAARNVISGNANQGIVLGGSGTTANLIRGNLIGLNAAGTAALGNTFPGVALFGGANANTIGGPTPGAGNTISGNLDRGITLSDAGTDANLIQGNLIGLNPAGTAPLPNGGRGIDLYGGAQANLIGGGAGLRNIISGNAGAGITLSGTGTNLNRVEGNTIGLNATASAPLPNAGPGVQLFGGPQATKIGGTTLGTSNLIAGNNGNGIELFDSATAGTAIRGNSLHGNTGGIALLTGANAAQPAPALTSAILGSGGTTIGGTLTGFTPGATFRVEFFANPAGTSQGRTFLGSLDVPANGAGGANFTTTLPPCVPAALLLTATATSPAGNTSPFSATRPVTTADADADGLPDSYESAHSLNPALPDAAADRDGDGLTNLQEFLAGTDPLLPASALRITALTAVGPGIAITFPTILGKIYRLETRDTLTTGTWSPLLDQFPGTGAPLTLLDPAAPAPPTRFYRALVLP